MSEYNIGDKITIKINGKEIETTIDKNGTQRLPNNRLFRHLIDTNPSIDFNQLWLMVGNGMISEDELRQFYQNIGYSVGGYGEVFDEDEIENLIWDD